MTRRVFLVVLAIQAVLAIAAWFAIPQDSELEYVWQKSDDPQALLQLYKNQVEQSPESLEARSRYARVQLRLDPEAGRVTAWEILQQDYRESLAHALEQSLKRDERFAELSRLYSMLWQEYKQTEALEQFVELSHWLENQEEWIQGLIELYQQNPSFENLQKLYGAGAYEYSLKEARERLPTASAKELLSYFDWGLAQGRPDLSWEVFELQPHIDFYGKKREDSLLSLFYMFHDYSRILTIYQNRPPPRPVEESMEMARLQETLGQHENAWNTWNSLRSSAPLSTVVDHQANLALLMRDREQYLNHRAELAIETLNLTILQRTLFEMSFSRPSHEILEWLNRA